MKSQVVRDRTKFQIPARWKLEDLGGIRPVEQVLKSEKIVTKKLSYKDVVTAKSAVELREKKVCIGVELFEKRPM